MPKLFVIDGYQISIWSAENGEPIHVYVSRRRPSKNSPKLWLSKEGYFYQANPNDKRIPPVTLNSIIKKLNYISDDVRAYWIAYHQYEKYQDE